MADIIPAAEPEVKTGTKSINTVNLLEMSEKMLIESLKKGVESKIYEAGALWNIKMRKLHLLRDKMSWEAYVQEIGYEAHWANKLVNGASGIADLCINTLPDLPDHEYFFFTEKIVKRLFRDVYKDIKSIDMKILAKLRNDQAQLMNYLSGETKLSRAEVMGLLPSPADQGSATGTEASAPPKYVSAFVLSHAEEHGLIYNHKRGWINKDGSDLTEQQRIDLLDVRSALDSLGSIMRPLDRVFNEFKHVAKRTGEYKKFVHHKQNPILAVEARQICKDSLNLLHRMECMIHDIYAGDPDNDASEWIDAPYSNVEEYINDTRIKINNPQQ